MCDSMVRYHAKVAAEQATLSLDLGSLKKHGSWAAGETVDMEGGSVGVASGEYDDRNGDRDSPRSRASPTHAAGGSSTICIPLPSPSGAMGFLTSTRLKAANMLRRIGIPGMDSKKNTQ